VDLL
jgi:hypothetical protein